MHSCLVLVDTLNCALDGAFLYRSDSYAISATISDDRLSQAQATFRFVAKAKISGAPLIIKTGADFQIEVSPGERTVIIKFELNKNDTLFLPDLAVLYWEIERTISETVTTLIRGTTTILADLAVNYV